jgi:kynurenine formamidase
VSASASSLYSGERREWGRWGDEDEVGRVNVLDERMVRESARACIRSGKRFSLALPIGHPGGDPTMPGRTPPRVTVTNDASYYRDGRNAPLAGGACFAEDSLQIHCHGTTHMDALGHSYADGQLWNGYPADTTVGGLSRAAVGALAERTVVGRAVLVDLPRAEGVAHLRMGRRVTADDVRRTLEAQGTQLRRGDIVILRTGIFTLFYGEGGPEAFYRTFDEPGLTYEPQLLDLLNEFDIVGVGSDTMCNEQQHCAALEAGYPLHILLQRNLGITFHEALWLEQWAQDCATDRLWDAFYVAAPLRLVHGSGAPMNPVVIK